MQPAGTPELPPPPRRGHRVLIISVVLALLAVAGTVTEGCVAFAGAAAPSQFAPPNSWIVSVDAGATAPSAGSMSTATRIGGTAAPEAQGVVAIGPAVT